MVALFTDRATGDKINQPLTAPGHTRAYRQKIWQETMAYAEINSQENNGLRPPIPDVNIKMLVNAKGSVCLVHDRPFSQTPLWIKYKQSSRLVEILFDNGSVLSIDWSITDTLNSYLVNATKVNVVRTEQSKPVEGWETLLINDQYN